MIRSDAEYVVEEIIEDLRGREGLGDAWDKIRCRVQEQIMESWVLILMEGD